MCMAGTLGYGWHEGSRGEYLAQYFLTALGVSAPVIRQEDIGVDFYCALARLKNKKLTFHSPYIVQHGAPSKKFAYRKRAEIDWLFSQALPLFVCIVDQSQFRFRLYSTSPMWVVRHFHGHKITQLELCPDDHRDVREMVESNRRREFRIPLGNPIVDLTLGNLRAKRARATKALKKAIQQEQNNLTYDKLGVHIARWFKSPIPNSPESLQDLDAYFWNDKKGQNIAGQIDHLKDVALMLALNLSAQGNIRKLQHLAPVFALFPKGAIPPRIIPKLSRIITKHISVR